MAMRISRLLRSNQHLSSFSEKGSFSTFSLRQRYTLVLKNQTDPTIADFFYEKWLHAWCGDAPSYHYWWVTSFAMGSMVAILTRHWFFNPDLYGRKQESRKPMPDRHRQWSYSLPFYNHRLRNFVVTYRNCMVDNEPDWNLDHPLGYRPNRKLAHKRPPLFCFTVPRYYIEDPLYTSVTHENMNRIYEEIGYQKKPKTDEDED